MSRATVVLVHGCWAGAWCFDAVVKLLRERGIETMAEDLPGRGASREPLADLHDSANAVRALLDELDGPVTLLGHSFGGMVITEAAANHPAVRHLIYLCAFMPDTGETLQALAESAPSEEMLGPHRGDVLIHEDGTMEIEPDAAADLFYADCSPADTETAVNRLRPDLAAVGAQAPAAIAWHQTPSSYVICSRDRALSPTLQRRLARRSSRTLELPASHSPFLSRPEACAELVADLAAA